MEKKLFIDDKNGFVELLEVFGSDLTVVNAARVSFHKESHMDPIPDQEGGGIVGYRLAERDEKLINYLAKHQHVTPFFHPMLRFRLKMPIFVAREWFRHVVGFARNEVSRRYVTEPPEIFVPEKLRKRDKNIRQGSSPDSVESNDALVSEMREYAQKSVDYYNRLLESGVCPEQARMILPQSMYTEFIETASLSAYARLVNLRSVQGAQKEIRDYAFLVAELVKFDFSVSWKALMKVESKV